MTAQCCFFIASENIRKPLGFLMFSGAIEKQHWTVMGYSYMINHVMYYGL